MTAVLETAHVLLYLYCSWRPLDRIITPVSKDNDTSLSGSVRHKLFGFDKNGGIT